MTSSADEPQDWRGEQLPRVSSVPEYVDSAGDEAIELAAMAGLALDPWQQWVLRHSLGERADGKWAATEVGLVVGRQNGKNPILEARELAELFLVAPLVGPRLVIHSAHQFKTALEHFRRLRARIKATPELLARVKHRGRVPVGLRESHGEESIELEDGSRILFAARTSSGGQGAGFTADLLVWDEAWNLPDSIVGMVLPTISAKTLQTPGVQVWYTSQAVNQQSMPNGVQLARIRERGIANRDPGLCYAEWSVDELEFKANPAMAGDPRAWAKANPALGVRIEVEHVAREYAGAMPWQEFLAHRLGIGDWPATSMEAGRVISSEAMLACAERDPSNRITSRPVFAVDSSPDQGRASIAVGGKRADGLLQAAVYRCEDGTDWVIPACVELKKAYPGSRFLLDGTGSAVALEDPMRKAHLHVKVLTAAEYGQACMQWYAAVTGIQPDGQGSVPRFRYPFPQPELDAALAVARKSVGEGWKWVRRTSTGDITPLVAVTLASLGCGAFEAGDRDQPKRVLRGATWRGMRRANRRRSRPPRRGCSAS